MLFTFQNICSPILLDPESIKKNTDTPFCSLKATDYNANNNFLE